MVEAYDAATEPRAKGALLRREGLYHSHLIEWRKARDAGALNALVAKPSGPKTRTKVTYGTAAQPSAATCSIMGACTAASTAAAKGRE